MLDRNIEPCVGAILQFHNIRPASSVRFILSPSIYQAAKVEMSYLLNKQYWVYDGYNFVEGSPRHISELGLPDNLSEVDAAFVWGKNGKTYIFRGVRRTQEASELFLNLLGFGHRQKYTKCPISVPL